MTKKILLFVLSLLAFICICFGAAKYGYNGERTQNARYEKLTKLVKHNDSSKILSLVDKKTIKLHTDKNNRRTISNVEIYGNEEWISQEEVEYIVNILATWRSVNETEYTLDANGNIYRSTK